MHPVRKPQLLVVEDEPDMAELLGQALRESGFEVTIATNGRDGLRLAPEHDLVVLDVMMPSMNGFDVARALRQDAYKTPLLFLTARDSVRDRVKGLELGDDYLLKPFALEELIARVRALLRRTRDSQDTLEYADLWLDRRNRQARRGTDWLHLSNTEFAVLEMLVLNPEATLPKSALIREIWHDAPTRDDNIVEVYISALRNKMESMGRSRLIHTVRGAGYVLEARES